MSPGVECSGAHVCRDNVSADRLPRLLASRQPRALPSAPAHDLTPSADRWMSALTALVPEDSSPSSSSTAPANAASTKVPQLDGFDNPDSGLLPRVVSRWGRRSRSRTLRSRRRRARSGCPDRQRRSLRGRRRGRPSRLCGVPRSRPPSGRSGARTA